MWSWLLIAVIWAVALAYWWRTSGPGPERPRGERRRFQMPWKRPRSTDLKTGERVYRERRGSAVEHLEDGARVVVTEDDGKQWVGEVQAGTVRRLQP